MSDDFLEVRVMDWITDSPLEQRSHLQTMDSFNRIRRLDIRLTGWTINQTKRIHVGVNSVPTIISSIMYHASIQDLSIDLECLVKGPALANFCSLISSSSGDNYASINRLTITCSGEEEMSHQALQMLGNALKSLRSISTLRLVGINPGHLSTILSSMKTIASFFSSCIPHPALRGTDASCHRPAEPNLCRRILPKNCCNPYKSLDSKLVGYPQELQLEGVTFSNEALADLVYLLRDENQCSISSLTLTECTQFSEDLDFMRVLMEGRTILRDLSLQDYLFRAHQRSRPWWKLPAQRAANAFPGSQGSKAQGLKRLRTLELIDCSGQRKMLEELAKYATRNDGITKLHVRTTYNLSIASSLLRALHHRTIVEEKPSDLLELSLLANWGLEQLNLQLLSQLLSDRNCNIRSLRLNIRPPLQLDVLGDGLTDNTSLRCLSLSGSPNQDLDMAALECFVSKLNEAPNLKSLELRFPSIDEYDKGVIDIFETNITLEDIQIRSGPPERWSLDKPNDIAFFGLRNLIRNFFLSHGLWTPGAWKAILHLLLSWEEKKSVSLALEAKRRELVLVSGIWFALIECPQLVSEMEPMM